MKYESFSIRIEPSPEGSYAVSVESPQGEGTGTFEIPVMGRTVTSSGRALETRDCSGPRPATEIPALALGTELFRALVRNEVSSLFHSSLGRLGARQGLRISISINPRRPELAALQALPWEMLCRPETQDFLCLSRRTPVVRSLDAHRERRPAPARPNRLRILAVSASPRDCTALDLARERTNLEAAWKAQKGKVEIVFLDRGGVDEIRRILLESHFHILHFMGHGRFDEQSGEGSLVFEGRDGTCQVYEGRSLAQLLRDFETLRLVVLNACHTADAVGARGLNPFSGVASALVMGGVPAVVAMSGPVSDLAAVAFSQTFYERLAIGDSIEAAVTEGRLAIQRADPTDGAWAIPGLFLRTSEGLLFAPRSTVWARRAALLAGFAVALVLIWGLASGWVQERRAAEVMRHANDGVAFLGIGAKHKARDAFRSALALDPDNAAALGNLSVVELQLGDDEAALVHLQAAVGAAPEEAVHHYNLGALLALKKRYEEALPSLQRAIEIDPDYVYAYNELGNVYLELDHPAEARKAFETGLRRDRTVAKLHKNLARTALVEGSSEEAVHHLETALPLYPPADSVGKAESFYWLAAAQAATGRTVQVCEALRRFEALDPHLLSAFAKDATQLAERHRCNS